MTVDTIELLEEWLTRVKASQKAHYEASKYYSKLHKRMGIIVIVLTLVVSSSFVSKIDNMLGIQIKLIIGSLSVVSVIFASLQTFYKHNEESVKHRVSAAKYGGIRRETEILLCHVNSIENQDTNHLINQISSIKRSYDVVSESSPEIPIKIWDRISA